MHSFAAPPASERLLAFIAQHASPVISPRFARMGRSCLTPRARAEIFQSSAISPRDSSTCLNSASAARGSVIGMDIVVENLTQVWGEDDDAITALDSVSHHFRSGRLTCLLGPSGCGKSTLVQIIGGIETATAGHIRIVDPSAPSAPPAKPGERSVMMWQ